MMGTHIIGGAFRNLLGHRRRLLHACSPNGPGNEVALLIVVLFGHNLWLTFLDGLKTGSSQLKKHR